MENYCWNICMLYFEQHLLIYGLFYIKFRSQQKALIEIKFSLQRKVDK